MRKLFFLALLILALAPASVLRAQAPHEYAPLEEKTVNYKDWTYKRLNDGKEINLRSYAKGKKLVMVVYFAPWCGNWKNEMPVAAKLYEKYKDQGFDVVGVSEYGSIDEVKANVGEKGAPYTVVTESEARDARDKTTHYGYRQTTGDTRRWGSPWNIFLIPSKLTKSGDVLAEKAFVVNGELIEADAEKFIRAQLGLPALPPAQAANASISIGTPCEPLKAGELKKP
ncbi:MAG: TlpA family protein disulfide reductase [Acidobacteria bacterium]|nr:TlpA family protein disulfide reductase [Acidobacteriota bacterium]